MASSAFKATHERLYGFATDEAWEVDTLRVIVKAPPLQDVSGLGTETIEPHADPVQVRKCWFDGGIEVDVPFFDRDRLPVGRNFPGPAIIEDAWSTIVIDPGATAWTDKFGHLHIDTETTTK